MPRRRHTRSEDWLFPKAAVESDAQESSLLDVIDTVLNKGAVVNGDLVLGLANVDLIYAKLSVLLSAFDRVMGQDVPRRKRGSTQGTSKRVPKKRR
jgi:hypothetical protein